jgi:hypothetical protein
LVWGINEDSTLNWGLLRLVKGLGSLSDVNEMNVWFIKKHYSDEWAWTVINVSLGASNVNKKRKARSTVRPPGRQFECTRFSPSFFSTHVSVHTKCTATENPCPRQDFFAGTRLFHCWRPHSFL